MNPNKTKPYKTNLYFRVGKTIYARDSRGHIFMIDAEDLQVLKSRCFFRNKNSGYFEGRSHGKVERIHRLIMEAMPGQNIDHINRRKNDNRKKNLRFCTNSQNQANTIVTTKSSTGVKGVFANNPTEKWKAPTHPYKSSIRVEGHSYHLGYFDTIAEAKTAYDLAAIQHFGAFANSI